MSREHDGAVTRLPFAAALLAAGSVVAPGADAAVTISARPTAHMSCGNGLCMPTAKNAVLDVSDLESMLAGGNVKVATAGSGVSALDIRVRAALGWQSGSGLTLDAQMSISVAASVTVAGAGALSLLTDDGAKGGTLAFVGGGSIGFANVGSSLSINGESFTLEDSLPALAAAIAAIPAGAYALAGPYDAKGDGTYPAAPIATTFTGKFEGLGNTISNLSIDDEQKAGDGVGLFALVGTGGAARDIRLASAFVTGDSTTSVGALAGANLGTIGGSSATGRAGNGLPDSVGGLVGLNEGMIDTSSSAISVAGAHRVGGLAGASSGTIIQSFATGSASGGTFAGGLVGFFDLGATIRDSYAMGTVSNGTFGGGLIGYNEGAKTTSSYSTGAATGGSSDGGFAGFDDNTPAYKTCYWDTTTSGTDKATGNQPNVRGITGLTTTQLTSGLPPGLSPRIWSEDPKINGGLPYLLANPPQ
ncbi:MAG TPA: hypothetical protein VGI20_15365 [Rhizomicrobium sp.]